MLILAMDTSSKAASCALLRDGQLIGDWFLHVPMTHSQTMLPMVQSLLSAAEVSPEAIDAYAVTTGPGSFTGLRIGIAAVKGMATALEKPCIGVSTLEALAHNAETFCGLVVPVMDARRSQVYTAVFRGNGRMLTRESEDEALSIEALRERLRTEQQPVLLVGDGAMLCQQALAELPHVAAAPERMQHQRASSAAAVAYRLAQAGKTCTAHELAPSYLRLPQAERERLARLQR